MASIRSRIAIIVVLAVAGCGAPPDDMQPVTEISGAGYRLGPGDQVRLITIGEEQLTGQFRVDANGTIDVPLIGAVTAQGLTPAELGETATEALRTTRLYRNPSVSVEVISYRPFFILGEVNRPGQYPYQPEMTVVTAVAVAGGFTYRAIDDRFSIVRTVNGQSQEGRSDRQTKVQPGDVITVYERRF